MACPVNNTGRLFFFFYFKLKKQQQQHFNSLILVVLFSIVISSCKHKLTVLTFNVTYKGSDVYKCSIFVFVSFELSLHFNSSQLHSYFSIFNLTKLTSKLASLTVNKLPPEGPSCSCDGPARTSPQFYLSYQQRLDLRFRFTWEVVVKRRPSFAATLRHLVQGSRLFS